MHCPCEHAVTAVRAMWLVLHIGVMKAALRVDGLLQMVVAALAAASLLPAWLPVLLLPRFPSSAPRPLRRPRFYAQALTVYDISDREIKCS